MTNPASDPRPNLKSGLGKSRVRRDQVFFAYLALVLLVGSMLMQPILTQNRRSWKLVQETPESEKSYRSLAINFPRLTLGGFRGLLSTVLWQQAEDDKNEHRWLELETKYDMIAALQPYFVSVYLYHAWNQAYNLSAQWEEEDTKYKWVLDGQAYLYKGEEYNPGNPDLYLEQGHMYFMKIGGAHERIFYRADRRADIARLHELNDTHLANSDATIALKHVREFVNHHDALTGDNYFHMEELRDPEERAAGTGWGVEVSAPTDPKTGFNLFSARTDGKKPTDPMEFRYGLSPFYFGYCEYVRCMAAGGPATSSNPRIIDAWPGLSLRMWCRDDLYYVFQIMNQLFGPDADQTILSTPEKLNAKILEAHDCFRNVPLVGPRAIDLLKEHLGRYPMNVFIHTKHILETESYIAISKAESALFDALMQRHLAGDKLTPNVIALLQNADNLYQQAYPITMKWVDTLYPIVEGQPPDPNRPDTERYALALKARSKGIEALLTLPPNEKPDMSFFQDEVVEK